MWFNRSSKLGALLCPKTIQISADPNCFIFSMILSSLWCPNKRRKLKLIAIFVFGSDSDCCSAAEHKHFPLIKHPSGHEEAVRAFLLFLTSSFFILPLFAVTVQYFATGRDGQTKQEMRKMYGKGYSSKEVLCHCWNFLFFLLFHTFRDRATQ